MTFDEAIEVLKSATCYECTTGTDSTYNCYHDQCPLKRATNKAIEALEKRIPALVKDFHCPACGNAVSSKKKDGKYIMEYCKACGQALKWGE